jgi:hypothetical protein
VFRSLATRTDPVTGATSVDVARVIDAVRAVGQSRRKAAPIGFDQQ